MTRSLPFSPNFATKLSVGAIAVACMTTTSSAQCPELAKLAPSPAMSGDNAGRAVAIHNNLAVVGAELDDENSFFDSGSAYVFRFNGTTWVQEFKFVASDAKSSDNFGHSVAVRNDAIKGDRVVIGSPKWDGVGTDSGSAYVFQFAAGVWSLEKKLIASDSATGDNFGADVAIDNDTIVVGAPFRDQAGSDNGAAYVFREGLFGWLEETKLTANDGLANDHFGISVSVSGNLALIGSNANDVSPNPDSGSAYIYTRVASVWSHTAKIFPAVRANFDNFGTDVSIKGTVAIIGSPNADVPLATDSGAAYIFEPVSGVWTEKTKLTAMSPANFDHFGASVATTGTLAIVGAPNRDAAGTDSGLAYNFASKNGVWALDVTYLTTSAATSDQVGYSVAVTAKRAIIGAPGHDESASDSGNAGVYIAGDLLLTALPSNVMAGNMLTFTTSCGMTGTPVVLIATKVNSTPIFNQLVQFVFSASDQFVLPATVPSGLTGNSLGFTSYRLDPFNQIKASNEATVFFN